MCQTLDCKPETLNPSLLPSRVSPGSATILRCRLGSLARKYELFHTADIGISICRIRFGGILQYCSMYCSQEVRNPRE